MPELQPYVDKLINMGIDYAPKLFVAILTLIIGLWIISGIRKGIAKALDAQGMDPSLKGFLSSVLGILLKAMLILAVIDMVGIEVTSFIAILGAAGLAVGMALSGTLQNFAGGVMLLIFRPFKVGDVIEAQGYTGKVAEIQIFNTILKTPDNKTIIIPNSPLSSGTMVNYSTEATRRVDFVFGIGYDDNIDQAKSILNRLIEHDHRILKDPGPLVVVGELADSSVNFTTRVWVKSADYWDVFFDMTENVKKTFDKEGISIPYPQQDLHMHEVTKA